MLHKLIIFSFFTSLCFSQLKIAAASNLYEVLDSIQSQYKAELEINYASSSLLTNQILHSKHYDLFLSADSIFPQKIMHLNALKTKAIVYCYGRIILWKKSGTINLKNARRIAIANPRLAPYGKAALRFLMSQTNFNMIEKKLIYTQNLRQVNQHIKLQSVDMAITAASSSVSTKLKHGFWEKIPFPKIPQSLILLKPSKEATSFLNFLFSEKSKQIFAHFRYERAKN